MGTGWPVRPGCPSAPRPPALTFCESRGSGGGGRGGAVPPAVPRPGVQGPGRRLGPKVMIEVDSRKQPHGCCGNGRATAESLSPSLPGPQPGVGMEEGMSHKMGPPPCPIRNGRRATRSCRVAERGWGELGGAAHAFLAPAAHPPHGAEVGAPERSPTGPTLVVGPRQPLTPVLSRQALLVAHGAPTPGGPLGISSRGSRCLPRGPSFPHPPTFPSRRRSRSPAAASLQSPASDVDTSPRRFTLSGSGRFQGPGNTSSLHLGVSPKPGRAALAALAAENSRPKEAGRNPLIPTWGGWAWGG